MSLSWQSSPNAYIFVQLEHNNDFANFSKRMLQAKKVKGSLETVNDLEEGFGFCGFQLMQLLTLIHLGRDSWFKQGLLFLY